VRNQQFIILTSEGSLEHKQVRRVAINEKDSLAGLGSGSPDVGKSQPPWTVIPESCRSLSNLFVFLRQTRQPMKLTGWINVRAARLTLPCHGGQQSTFTYAEAAWHSPPSRELRSSCLTPAPTGGSETATTGAMNEPG
jgi:hypothetical protein